MQVLGVVSIGAQQALTNPLSTENELLGQATLNKRQTETQATQLVREQPLTDIASPQVVNQNNETSATAFNADHNGRFVDITV